MLLEVRHLTQYLYSDPVRESVMEVWMQPQRSGHQRLISFDLEVDPVAQVFSYADSFGNAVHHFDVPQPHQSLDITARAAVETQPPATLPEVLDLSEWDRLNSNALKGDNFDFLHPHGYARGSAALDAYVAEQDLGALRRRDPLSAVRELSGRIFSSFGYEAGVTRADSPIDDVLVARKGVCQDFAHVMITICRAWGVPARYVSGYLFTDRKAGDRSDPEATHAWVEVFLPSLRWIGFDPTNNTVAGERHIICAVGRDYSDVPPSRGVFKGETESRLAVGVSIRRARTAAAEPEFQRLSRPPGRPTGGRTNAPAAGSYEQQRLHQMQQQQ